MACSIFLTVRTASTRLPKKAFLEIGKKPLIRILIDHLKTVKNIDRIVICTTTEKSDDELTKYLRDLGLEVFRGDNVDVLNRLYQAAQNYDLRQFIVVEGDDVFCDPALIERTYNELTNSDYEFITWKDLPFGVSPLGIKTNKLEVLVKNKATKNTETGWGKAVMESGLFKIKQLKPDDAKLRRTDIRLTVDYKEDFELVKKIYENLPEKYSLLDIIRILDKNPQWLKINEGVKNKYEKNLGQKMTKLVMKKKGLEK